MHDMKKIIFFILLLSFMKGYSQEKSTNNLPVSQIKTEEYVFGIGNKEFKIYADVLTDLQNDQNVLVYAYCETHQIIGVKVIDNAYKSYDAFRDFLLNKYPGIMLFRKDGSIFSKDCKNEILKQ